MQGSYDYQLLGVDEIVNACDDAGGERHHLSSKTPGLYGPGKEIAQVVIETVRVGEDEK